MVRPSLYEFKVTTSLAGLFTTFYFCHCFGVPPKHTCPTCTSLVLHKRTWAQSLLYLPVDRRITRLKPLEFKITCSEKLLGSFTWFQNSNDALITWLHKQHPFHIPMALTFVFHKTEKCLHPLFCTWVKVWNTQRKFYLLVKWFNTRPGKTLII
jgi:hypothetical protein